MSVFKDASTVSEVTKQYSTACKSIVWIELEGLKLTIANVYMAPENYLNSPENYLKLILCLH